MFELTKVNDVFADFYQQLKEAKKINEQTVFQYETPSGNKAARSHIFKLRQSKSAIEKKRKEAKAEALEFGRALDSEAKNITSQIEDMIAIHELPLKEIEDREKDRISKIQLLIDEIKYAGIDKESGNYKDISSADMRKVYDCIFNTIIDDKFAEFKTLAFEAKDGTLKRLINKIEELKKSEEEAAELERLRKEAAERSQREHDERIAREAKAEAERKAQEEAIRKDFEAKAEKERIEREKKEAIERAEREKKQAIENLERAKREQIAAEERARIEREEAEKRQKLAIEQAKQAEIDRQKREQEKIKAEQEMRESNKRHIGNIRRQAKESIMQIGFSEEQAKSLVMAIHNKEVANITINY